MKKFLSGNDAVAEAVRLCRTQLVAAYPITPQTMNGSRNGRLRANWEER